MTKRWQQGATHRKSLAAALALSCALVLSGCSNLPFDMPNLPFELPQLPQLPELPFDLPDPSSLPNPFAALGVSTSVEEARAAKASEKTSTLTSDDLVQAFHRIFKAQFLFCHGSCSFRVSTRQPRLPFRRFSVTGCKSASYADFRSINGRTLDAKVRHVESASLILRSWGNKRC